MVKPKGPFVYYVICWMMFLLIILLLINAYFYLEIRHKIADYNRDVIQDCLLLECHVTAWGDVECETPTLASDLKDNDTWFLPINHIPIGNQAGGD